MARKSAFVIKGLNMLRLQIHVTAATGDWRQEGRWGGAQIEILLESLLVCLSLPYLPDGRGLWSGTAVAQSIR